MSIQLKEHNAEAYQRVKEGFESSSRVAVIHPTGTGKSFLALKFLEENSDKKAIYIAPTNAILHSIKREILDSGMDMRNFPNLDRKTYQKLMSLSSEEIEKLEADIIILDEFHHCGAPEWGSGIDRLIERNPHAQILGLSATPIRYFDKARDMAEEMFGDNIASEMTLEEAISRGILPKAEYVSALYEFEDELARIQSEIDDIKNPVKRQQAQELLEQLSRSIDDNTKNLPTMLSKHMKVKNGKYIIFCKSIEDMQEKMEQAQKMFGEVNPNITIYAVSSKLKENEQTLSHFEQDNDENTLKLMYAVDMLNEGYHINDLDGVVMMRPTSSPNIYTQQLGRALSVRGKGEDAKTPVVIDLVNNFDSIRIIEDLYERLSQYESTGNRPRKDKSISGLIIHDETKEFSDIAKKITELSRNTVTLEEKIEIFDRFFEEGNEEIDGQTVFEGYPIGHWAISIRSYLNTGRDSINPTEEQLKKIQELGILDSKIDSTIDEKIDAIIEWNEKYPKARVSSRDRRETIREYVNSDEEYQNLLEELDRIERYYSYVKVRYSKEKLSDEQIDKLRNGEARGVFGHSNETLELAKRYRISADKISYITDRYGTVEEALKSYFMEDCKMSEDIELRTAFDVNLRETKSCDLLFKGIIGRLGGFYIYDSEKLLEELESLPDDEYKEVIKSVYGINGDKPLSVEETAKKLGIKKDAVNRRWAKCLRTLREPSRKEKYMNHQICEIAERIMAYGLFTEEAKERAKNSNIIFQEEIEIAEEIKEIFINSNIMFYPDQEYAQEEIDIDRDRYFDLVSRLDEKEKQRQEQRIREAEERKQALEEAGIIELEDLNLSNRTYIILKRAGIDTLQGLLEKTDDELIQIRNLGRKCLQEIVNIRELAENNDIRLFIKEKTEETQIEIETAGGQLTGQDIGQATFDASTNECDEAQQAIESELLNQKKNSIGDTN